jgi:uncharacterized protein (DUF433 family)
MLRPVGAQSAEIRLGRGVYTVSEACRILGSPVTPRKVHYWLHTGLLGEPFRMEFRGRPTLLSFEQLIKIKTLQRLRGKLQFSLQQVRRGLDWILEQVVADDWAHLHFVRTGAGELAVVDEKGETFALHSRQRVLPNVIAELDAVLVEARESWDTGIVRVQDLKRIVSDAAVMGGAPVIAGTRIETAFIAHVAPESMGELVELFPHVDQDGLREALKFEGIKLA